MTKQELHEVAESKLRDAQSAWYDYAKECEVGDERIFAFEVYEMLRRAKFNAQSNMA